MIIQTQDAVNWALTQTTTDDFGNVLKVSKDTPILLVNFVRQYFNDHNITYNTFSYDDLKPFLI